MTKVRQEGLFCKTEDALEAFADRVSDFNKKKGFIVVEMEGRETDGPVTNRQTGQVLYDGPHWDITLEFRTRAYCKDFWTDPDYQRQVLV